jgi:hypothetical protein
MREITWHGLDEDSVEVCRVDTSGGSVSVRSSIEGPFGILDYELHAATDWTFQSMHLVLGTRTLDMTRRRGRWDVDGKVHPDLDSALEVDVSATPLSNTLPIRRLGLRVGQSADIITAYVAVPELTVAPDPQRYTRVARSSYLYESRDSPFSATITVDDDGLVVDYPGLFERGSGRRRP